MAKSDKFPPKEKTYHIRSPRSRSLKSR